MEDLTSLPVFVAIWAEGLWRLYVEGLSSGPPFVLFVCLSSAAQWITKLKEYLRDWFYQSSKVCRASPQPHDSLTLPHSGICCAPPQGTLSCAPCIGAPGSCHCHARNILPGPVLQSRPGHLASEALA